MNKCELTSKHYVLVPGSSAGGSLVLSRAVHVLLTLSVVVGGSNAVVTKHNSSKCRLFTRLNSWRKYLIIYIYVCTYTDLSCGRYPYPSADTIAATQARTTRARTFMMMCVEEVVAELTGRIAYIVHLYHCCLFVMQLNGA